MKHEIALTVKINDLNPFPPRQAKTGPFVILVCLKADNFTHQGRASSGWERVNPFPTNK